MDASLDMMMQGKSHQGLISPMMQDGESAFHGEASQWTHCGPYMYQWVPCQENGDMSQLVPPPFGYGETQAIDPFGQSYESSPCSWTNGGGDLSEVATPFGYQMAVPSAYIMSPQQQAWMSQPHHRGTLPEDPSYNQLSDQLSVDLLMEQLADKSTQQRKRGGSRGSGTCLLAEGLRTPSSLGTPVATATPSEAPTPISSSPRVLNQSAPASEVSSASAPS
jgi:hypothetical protein